MDEAADNHDEGSSSVNPFELDYTPSMRQMPDAHFVASSNSLDALTSKKDATNGQVHGITHLVPPPSKMDPETLADLIGPAEVPPSPSSGEGPLKELLERVRVGGSAAIENGCLDPLRVLDEILRLPEFIFEKPSYDKYHKSRLPQLPLPGYPPAIIPSDLFLLIINAFTATYPDEVSHAIGETDYVQKLSIEPDAELRVMGDLHGCAQAFVRMLALLMNEGFIDGGLRLTGQNSYLVFLGDFVDYGRNGCETLALMMLCRCINPRRVLVCRGNHEDCSIYARPEYGFLLELQSRYSDQIGPLRVAIDTSFECMPLAIFVGIKGNPAAGFAQLCHGGLEIDTTTIESFQRMLQSPDETARCLVSSQSSSRCNLQWGDFSGVAIHGGVASSTRGYTHDIEGTKAAISKLDVRCVFRGHQDHLHAAKNLVESFKEPVCLVPVELPQIDALKAHASWLSNHACSLEQLRYQGLRIGSLPPFMGPVFTFSNASSCRANYDEGFGMVTMAGTWEDCVVRYRIYRPELFTVRASVFAGSTQYLPDDLARAIDGEGGLESGDAPRTLSWTAVMPAFLNHHFTCIDAEGNAHVYVLPKVPPTSSPEGTPTSTSSPALSVPESFSRAFLARYQQPDGMNCGLHARFIEKVLAGEFIRERQEVCRQQEWHKVELPRLQQQQLLRQREEEEQLQRKRAAEVEALEQKEEEGELAD